MIKKIIIFLSVLIVLIAGGIAVFIATFDIDRYRPLLFEQLEKALGSPVRLDKISLAWRNGIAVELAGFKIYKDARSMDKPVAALDRASAKLHVGPLLQKKIDVSTLTLVHPQLRIIREADGVVRVNGISAAAAGSRAKPSAKSAAAPDLLKDLNIGVIKIESGELGFFDQMARPPARFDIHDLDVLVKNVSLSKPIDFQVKAGVFSRAQNVQAKGRLRVPSLSGPYELTDFSFGLDLATLDRAELERAVPAIQNAGITGDLKGVLNAEIGRLKAGPGGVTEFDARGTLKGGQVALSSIKAPLKNVSLDASVNTADLTLNNFSAELAGGRIQFKGDSKRFLSAEPSSRVQGTLRDLSLDALIPEKGAGEPSFSGTLSADLNGTANGLSWEAISRTLNGNARVSIKDPVVRNFNLLRTVFEQLGRIPGVVSFVTEGFPPQYQPRYQSRDTPMTPIDFTVQIVNGMMMFNDVALNTDTFNILASGRAGLDGSLDIRAMTAMERELSQILAQKAPQLQYVLDPTGRLSVPVSITGTTQKMKVKPEVDSLVERAVASKGQELVGDLLKKTLSKGQPAQGGAAAADGSAAGSAGAGTSSGASSGASSGESYQQILGKLFN